jgi:class 3 adenylate cyclase
VVEITVIFADLSSFTELTHNLGPEGTHEVVDAFLRMASDILVRHDAFIDKYIGDAVMALFNVPLRHTDHPKRAVMSASEIQSGLAILRERFMLDLQASVGIATGWARVGRVGSQDSKDYTAMGDVVNLAARLQGKARPGEIVVSKESYERVSEDFPDVPAELLTLKGFPGAVSAYRLNARADKPLPAESVDTNPSRTMGLGAVVFAILGAQCAVAVLISPLAVALGFGTLFGLSGLLIYIDKSAIRIPVLILAALGALANLYTLWHARNLRLQAVAEGNQQLGLMTALERRRTRFVLGTAIAVLVIVVCEILLHGVRHPG